MPRRPARFEKKNNFSELNLGDKKGESLEQKGRVRFANMF
jgi:hypothetical protein